MAAAFAATAGALAAVAQVKTNVPEVVAGTRAAIVGRIMSPRGSGGGRGAPPANAAANDEALAAVKTPADSAKLHELPSRSYTVAHLATGG